MLLALRERKNSFRTLFAPDYKFWRWRRSDQISYDTISVYASWYLYRKFWKSNLSMCPEITQSGMVGVTHWFDICNSALIWCVKHHMTRIDDLKINGSQLTYLESNILRWGHNCHVLDTKLIAQCRNLVFQKINKKKSNTLEQKIASTVVNIELFKRT